MHKLAEICVRRPVFASVLILSLVVVGIFSYFRLGVDRYPNIDFPTIVISTRLQGAAPEEIETEITDKIEEAVNTISGIDLLVSSSSEGISVVTVSFELSKDIDIGAQEIRDRINTILAELPREADPPLLEKVGPEQSPVMAIALSGPATIRDLTEFADKTLRRHLETVLGVGQVRVVGGRPRQVNVVVDTAKLSSLGLTVTHLTRALQAQNVQEPGGRVEQGLRSLTLRTYGRIESPEAFGDIAVTTFDNGYTVKVRDVARVEDGEAEALSTASVNGAPAVVLLVRKQSGTNTVAVVRRVKERLASLQDQLFAGWRTDVVRDQSDFILASVHTVQEHLVLGSLFAAGVVFLFLRRFRPTIIAAIAIPSSLIATFAAMEYMGFSLNLITLLAITLSVGIVIDDAVVVLENIFRFIEEKKMSPRQAAVEATREVGMAVTATSVSLIAVFLPVAFMGGLVGEFMKSFGLSMAFAVAVSLLVSFTITPMMASRWLTQRDVSAHASKAKGFYALIERVYVQMLRRALRRRWAVVVLMVLVIASTIPLAGIANKNFLPNNDESQFEIAVRTPEGSSLEATRIVLESIASRVRDLRGVQTTLVTQGDDQQNTRNRGMIYAKLVPVDERKPSQFEIMDQVRREILPQYAALELRSQVAPVPAIQTGNSAEVQFWIGGRDLDRLAEFSQILMDKLRAMPGVVDADTNFILGNPELGVRIDRAKASDLGVQVEDVAATLNVLVGGQEVTDYYEGGERYEVHVRAAAGDRRDVEGIGQVEVPSSKLGTVRLEDIVTFEAGTGPSLVNHISRQRQVLLYCNVLPGYSSQDVLDGLAAATEALGLPPGYTSGFAGRSREQGKTALDFLLAFVLSIVFMYLVLAAQFESWIHPVTILLALPLTVPFALLTIVVFDQSINIFSSLGIVVLFGIVKKNGILQVDHTNGLRKQGMSRTAAIMQANRDRLRPILMTTFAFVGGMIPLVVSSGIGAGTNRAIGLVIIGGQTLALALTLVATPVMYSIFDDWQQSRLWERLGLRSRPKATGPAAEDGEAQEVVG